MQLWSETTSRLLLRKIITALTLFALLFGDVETVFAQVSNFSKQVNYQAKLMTPAGIAVPDGTYNVAFRLYLAPVSATTSNIWEEQYVAANKVQVTNGLLSVMLGSQTSLANLNWNQPLYLGVEIGGSTTPAWDGEMSPRKQLGAVPAAFVADTLDGLNSNQFVRADGTSTVATSSAQSLITLNQLGAGNILDLKANNVTLATFLANGNVGIGTSSPYAKLSVAGDVVLDRIIATSTTASSTFANGINLTAGCFSLRGTCVATTTGITSLNGLSTLAQSFATGTDANINLTITSAGATHTFTPSWVGTLAATRGGTGLPTITANQLLLGGAGNTWSQVATSSLGLPQFSDLSSYFTLAAWFATTTNGLTEGGNNLYFTSARADARINATSTLGTLLFLPNLSRSTTTNATATSLFATTFAANAGALTSFTTSFATITSNLAVTGSATSTFANGLNLSTGCYAVNGVCVGSTGASSTLLVDANSWSGINIFTNILRSTSTQATSTNFFASILNATAGTFTSLFGTNATITNSTSTNLFATNLVASGATTSALNAGTITGTTGTLTSLLGTNATITNATATNLFTTNASTTNSTSTNLTVINATTTALSATIAFLSNLTGVNATATNLIAGNSTSTNLFATNASTTNSTSSFAFISNLFTATNGRFTSGLALTPVTNCTGSQALTTDGSGNIICGTISVGGASTGGGWTTNNVGYVTEATSSDAVGLGTSTPYAKLSIVSSSVSSSTLALRPAGGSTANNLDVYNAAGALTTVITAAGNLGVGTTTPTGTFAVAGTGFFSGLLSAIGGFFAPTATITSATATNLFATNAVFTGATTTALNAGTITGTNATLTSLLGTNATITNATATNLFATNASTTNSTSTNLTTINATTTALSATIAFLSNLTGVNATTSNFTATGATATTQYASIYKGGLLTIGTSTASTTIYGASTSTFGGGVNLANGGCFSIGGTCLTSAANAAVGGTGAIQFANGSAFAGDATNFFFDNTNKALALGTTTAYAKLTLQGAYGSQQRLFDISSSTNSNGSATSSLFTILANGNVGIGTSSPYAKLSVNGSVVASSFNLTGTTSTSTFAGALIGYNGISSPGASTTVTGNELFGLGAYSNTPGGNTTVIGAGAGVNGTAAYQGDNVVIGALASTTGQHNVVIGSQSYGGGGDNTVLGAFAYSNSGSAVVIGAHNYTGTAFDNSINIGLNQVAYANSAAIGWGVSGSGQYDLNFGFRNVASVTPSFTLTGSTDQYNGQNLARIVTSWIDSTNVTRKGRVVQTVFDTAEREYIRAESTGSGVNTSFIGGNVAVGTSSPWAKLSVQDTLGASTPLFDIASTTGALWASTSLFRVNANGNVGVGTTSPYAKLSVVGQIVSAFFTGTTTATSSFGGNLAINGTGTTTSTGGFNITAGCFAVNGTCLSAGSSASSTLLADNNTFSGQNIFANILRSTSSQATSTNLFASIFTATLSTFTNLFGTNATITNATATNIFATNASTTYASTSRLAVTGSGTSTFANGINLTNGGCFAVGGTCLSASGGASSGIAGAIQFSNGASGFNADATQFFFDNTTDALAIGTTTAYAKLTLQGAYGSQQKLFDIASSTNASGSATSSLFTILANGNVGIGTGTPQATLDVSGSIRGSALVLTASSTAYSTINSFGGFNGYVNTSGGIGTGGNDSVPNAQRLTAYGNLSNIGSIQGGELSLSSGGLLNAKVDYTTGSLPYKVSSGDLNGDGKPDIVVANSGSASISVFINNGSGGFAAKVDYTTLSSPRFVTLADFNGDGKLDIAVGTVQIGNYAAGIFLNNGNGTFGARVDYPEPFSNAVGGLSSGDFNGDGKMDIVLVSTGVASVAFNNGNGTFGPYANYNTTLVGESAVADFNGDGRPDIVTDSNGNNSISVLLNNGDGTFASNVDYTTGSAPIGVAAGDVNNDGKTDIIIGNAGGSSVSVFINNGNGTFAAKADYASGVGTRSVALGDMNGDGKLDIVSTNSGGTVSVIINNGNGTFATNVNYTIGSSPEGTALADFNGDGKLDVVATNQTGTSISTFLNNPAPALYVSGATGNISLGTTSPFAKFSIQNTYGSQLALIDISTTTATNGTATSSLFRINANGAISIGTSSPWAKLSLQGKGGELLPLFDIASSTNKSGSATTSVFRINANNAIGIGSTTPSALFGFAIGTTTLLGGTGTTSAVNGINLASGCFAIAGTCLNTSGASSTLLADANTFSGQNIFANILRSTSTQATSTNLFASIFTATLGTFTSLFGTNATITNATATNIFATNASSTYASTSVLAVTGNSTSTFASGINLTNGGCFSIAGTCIGNAAGGSSSGISGAIQFSNGASGFSADASNFFFDNTNKALALGTSTAYARLSLQGAYGSQQVLFDIASSTNSSGSATSSLFTVLANGNVGIGTSSPYAKLDIQGTSTTAVQGAEMISVAVNRNFSGAGNWTGSNWSVAGGKATHVAGANMFVLPNVNLTSAPVVGHTYLVSFDYTSSSTGSYLWVAFGGASSTQSLGQTLTTATETQSILIYAVSNAPLAFDPDAFWEGSIDNFSVTEVTPSLATFVIRNSDGYIEQEFHGSGPGRANNFIGVGSGAHNITGYANAAQGNYALYSNISGTDNAAQGDQALYSNTIGSYNSAHGDSALYMNTTGSYNSAQGSAALTSNTTGSYNTAQGHQALLNNTTGNFNTAQGTNALGGNINGSDNVAIGYNALGASAFDSGNVAVGSNVFGSLSAVGSSTAIGYYAGYNNFGTANLFVGYKADSGIFGSANASAIGAYAKVNSSDALILGTNFIDSGGLYYGPNVGIGTSSPTARLTVEADYGFTGNLFELATTSVGGVTQSVLSVDSAGTTTSSNGFDINNGCFSIAGVCITGGGGGGSSSGASGNIQFSDGVGGFLSNGNLFWDDVTSKLYVTGNFAMGNAAATSTVVGGFDVGGGNLTYDYSSGITSIASLNMGALNFDTDAGQVTWFNLPVSGTASAGTKESYSAQIGDTSVMTIYGEDNGAGTVQNLRVGIGTTSPYATLAVAGTAVFDNVVSLSTSLASVFRSSVVVGTTTGLAKFAVQGTFANKNPLFDVATSTNASGSATSSLFRINADGNISIGTSTGLAKLSIQDSYGDLTPFLDIATTTNASGSATSSLFRVSANGSVGIGTSTVLARFGLQGLGGSLQALFDIASSTNTNGSATTSVFRINANNAIGIGSTTPSALFGFAIGTTTLLGGTGTTSAVNGINLASGCFAVGGTCITGGGSGASTTLLGDSNTFSGGNTFARSTTTNATTTTFAVTGTATSTFASGINLTNGGCFAIGGACLTPGAAAAAGGTGAVQFAVGGIMSGDNTQFFFDNTTDALAIGTSTAYAKLTLQGAYGSQQRLFDISSSTNSNGSATSSLFTILANGNVGIGTSTPIATLDVNGAIRGQAFVITSSATTSGSAYTTLTANNGFSGFVNVSGGIGTGGVDSILNAQRITAQGNLINIGAIQAGELNLTSGGLFTASSSYTTASLPSSVATGDLNGDGKADLAVANYGSGGFGTTLSVFLNNGNGTFAPKVDYTTGTGPIDIAIGDLNGDGKADLAVTNYGAGVNSVSIFLNNGNGTFAAKQDYTTGTGPFSVAIADLNGDGKADLAVTNYNVTGTTLSVLLNNGNGTFAPKVDYTTGTGPIDIAIGDLNGDGKADLAVTNYGGGASTTVSVLLSNGNGTFATKVDYTTGTGPDGVAISDVNGDGKADIVTANLGASGAGNTLSVLLNNGNGTFAAKQDYTTGTGPISVAIGDLNGDGKADLAVTNYVVGAGNTLSVLLNNGNGTFAAKQDYTTGTGPMSIVTGDLNGDGKADLAVLNQSTASVSVFLNQATPSLYVSGATGNVSLGTTSPYAKLSIQDSYGDLTPLLDVSTTTRSNGTATSSLFRISANGNVGIGSTTPWAQLSVMGSSTNNTTPLLVIATSSKVNAFPLLYVSATSTGALDYVRVGIGTTSAWGASGLRDQLTVSGRIYSTWAYLSCDVGGSSAVANPGVFTSLANNASVSGDCGDFAIDSDSNQNGYTTQNSYPSALRIVAGLTVASLNNTVALRTNAFIATASSSPVLEARVNFPYQGWGSGGASTTLALIGFSDRPAQTANGSQFPNNFIGFEATSTANWQAYVVRGGIATTSVDTGIATTTTSSSTPRRFRVEVSSSTVNFLVDGTIVAVISTSTQVQVPLAPMVSVGKTVATGLASSEADISYLRVWIDDPAIANTPLNGIFQNGLTPIDVDPTLERDIKLNRTSDFARGTGAGVWYFASTSVPAQNMIVGFSLGSTSGVVEPASSSTKPIGIQSEGTIAGLITGNVPVVTSGRTLVLVSLANGVIHTGDDITVSTTTPGVGMRAVSAGYIIGHAIEAFDPAGGLGVCVSGSATSTDATSTCVGLVTVQLAVGWSEGETSLFGDIGSTVTDVAQALLDIGSTVFEKGAQFSKLAIGKVVAQTAVVKDFFAMVLNILPNGSINVPSGSNQIAGSDTLPVGATTYFVANTKVAAGAKIFITPRAMLATPIAVTDVQPGAGFTVTLAGQAATDIPFDWFMLSTYDAGGQQAAVSQSGNNSNTSGAVALPTPTPTPTPPLPPVDTASTSPIIPELASSTPPVATTTTP